MMAARAGAAHVYACEAFAPLAELADQITFINTPAQVTVMPVMSTRIVIDATAEAHHLGQQRARLITDRAVPPSCRGARTCW